MNNEMLIRRYQSALTKNTRKGAERIIQLEQENKQLKEENKELNKVCELYGQSLYNADLTKMKNILTELEEYMKENEGMYILNAIDRLQELKEKYK